MVAGDLAQLLRNIVAWARNGYIGCPKDQNQIFLNP